MNVVKLLWKFTKYAKYGLLLQSILCLFWSLKEALFPFLLKNIVNNLTMASAANNLSYINLQITLLIALWSLMEIAMRLQGYIASKVFPKLRGKVREYIFEKLSLRSLEYKQSLLSGDLASKVSELPKAVEQVFEVIYLHIPSIGCAFIIGSFLLFKVSILFGCVAIGWAFLHIFLSILFAKYCVHRTCQHAKSETELVGKIVDMISNRLTTHLYTTSTVQLDNLRKNQSDEIKQAIRSRMAIELPKYLQSALAILFMSIMLFLLALLWQKNKVSVGDFALVPMLSYSIVGMITWLSYLVNIFLKQIGFIKASAEIEEKSGINPFSKNETYISNVPKIKFNEVSYCYQPDSPVLENICFNINPGEKIALIGDSGAGKSTLLKIMAGVVRDYTGTVLVNNQELCFVPQIPELYNTTIYENIVLGQPNVGLKDVINIAKLVQADEFINQFPDGYQTIIGEKGNNLSVGQAQRIILARALIRNKKILILDESTSALDIKTEEKIFENLKNYLNEKILIIASHHHRTLAYVDRVLELVKGQLDEKCKKAIV